MAEKKMCPYCGGQMFMAKVIRASVVEATTDSNTPYNILKESKDKFDVEILKCARCKENITENSLVTGVKCKECGRIVGPMDVNEDSICNVCIAVKQRTELANASREDLIKMLLDAEKKVNPVAAKMEKQIEKADDATLVATINTTNVVENTKEESGNQDVIKEKKTTRKATRKKKDDTDNVAESVIQETETSVEEIPVESEAIDNLANQQEAPFPDIAMNPPEEVSQVVEEVPVNVPIEQEEQPIGANFKMFDEGEEPF